jgi:hypothetical protein
MKKFNLVISGILAFFIIFSVSLANVSAASKFKDVTLYEEEINYLTDLNIITGYPDGTFKPTAPIKRLQAVQMILRAKKINAEGAPNPNFTDVKPGDYGYEEIAKAVELGFISGKTDPKTGKKYFDPWGTLTREQMAKILVLAYGLKGTYHTDFKDVPKGSWSYGYISTLAANNITTGYQDGTFKPTQTLSRQHFAVFMARVLDDRFKPEPENSRYNPARMGEVWEIEVDEYGYQHYEIELVDAVTDGDVAWQMISEANEFNEPAPEGMKYILAKFRFKVYELEEEPFYAYSAFFEAVSKDGVVYDPAFVVEPEPALSTELYEGGEYEGWAAFLVDENDSPLIVWQREFQDELWFSLE